jgi:hypothetical protein
MVIHLIYCVINWRKKSPYNFITRSHHEILVRFFGTILILFSLLTGHPHYIFVQFWYCSLSWQDILIDILVRFWYCSLLPLQDILITFGTIFIVLSLLTGHPHNILVQFLILFSRLTGYPQGILVRFLYCSLFWQDILMTFWYNSDTVLSPGKISSLTIIYTMYRYVW